MKAWVVMCVALVSMPAWALNKCVSADGKVSFQDQPCTPGTAVQRAPEPRRSDAKVMSPKEMAAHFESETQTQLRKRAESISRHEELKRHPSYKEPEEEKSIPELAIGMSSEQVRRLWGDPGQIHERASTYGKTEQWVYWRGKSMTDYVYLANGTVTSVSRTR